MKNLTIFEVALVIISVIYAAIGIYYFIKLTNKKS